jgi:hypothetical protein
MYELCPGTLAGNGNVPGTKGIHPESVILVVFAVINPDVSGGIDNNIGAVLHERIFNRLQAGDVAFGMRQGNQFIIGKRTAKVEPQLPISPGNENFHLPEYILW